MTTLPFSVSSRYQDETVNSLLWRTAEANFIDSASRLLSGAGIRLQARYDNAELQHIAHLIQIAPEALGDLNAMAAVPSLSSDRFLRRKHIPVCPHCLGEAMYIRQAWHHTLVTVCPTHQCYLFAECTDCGQPIETNQVTSGFCSCGADIRELATQSADDASFFVSRLVVDPACGRERLALIETDGKLPDDLCDFLLFIARLSMGMTTRKNAVIDMATARQMSRLIYEMTDGLESRFEHFVRERVHAANAVVKGNFTQVIGSWYREMNINFGGEIYKPFRFVAYKIIICEAKSSINRMMKQIAAELQGYKTTFTAAEAARALGSSPDRVFAFVRTGALRGVIYRTHANELCLVDRADVEAKTHEAKDYIGGADVLKRLSITREIRDRLVRHGILHRVAEEQVPPFAKGDYLKAEVENLLSDLSTRCTGKDNGSETLSFEEISVRSFTDFEISILYQNIFDGNVSPVAVIGHRSGLMAYEFDAGDLRALLPTRKSGVDIELTIEELTNLTPWKYESINAWVQHGLLKANKKKIGRRQINTVALPDLIDFLSRNIVLADVAKRIESKSVWLSRNPVIEEATAYYGGRGILLSTDKMVKVLKQRLK